MSFDKNTWALQSAAHSFDSIGIWGYKTSEQKSHVIANGYFDSVSSFLTSGDKIEVDYLNGSMSLRVLSNVDGNVAVTPWESGVSVVGSIVLMGSHTTVGGNIDETITLAGVLATDIVITTLSDAGESNVTIRSSGTHAGNIVVEFSADPGSAHVVQYIILRATS